MSEEVFATCSKEMVASTARGDVKPNHILIIEDDQTLADLLHEAFRIRGYHCFVIRSKASAEHFLRNVQPDLVVVDYQLIGGVGLQAARIAAKMKVPVIVISGYPDVFDEARKLGFAFLKKPFTGMELLAIASTLLEDDPSVSSNPP